VHAARAAHEGVNDMNACIAQWARALARDGRGLTTVEYVIVLCLIAAVAVGTWSEFGGKVKEYLEGAAGDINTAIEGEG
jgi:Flp pilus assembly pilin Flp